ncbi:hypothetical protein [Allosphingosinicella indica]|uniref:hypothetical protein n=1 Tax=Allosphingosinicella indica TaxID=941907 RepID=UPI0012F4A201|nr:hypothetical protein [Allosphingosinicella indica]
MDSTHSSGRDRRSGQIRRDTGYPNPTIRLLLLQKASQLGQQTDEASHLSGEPKN